MYHTYSALYRLFKGSAHMDCFANRDLPPINQSHHTSHGSSATIHIINIAFSTSSIPNRGVLIHPSAFIKSYTPYVRIPILPYSIFYPMWAADVSAPSVPPFGYVGKTSGLHPFFFSSCHPFGYRGSPSARYIFLFPRPTRVGILRPLGMFNHSELDE